RPGRRPVVRPVRQPHAHVVGHDAAVAVTQAQHQVPPVEAPRRVAVDHDDDLAIARALVEVAQVDAWADFEAVGGEGIVGELVEHRGSRAGQGRIVARALDAGTRNLYLRSAPRGNNLTRIRPADGP